MFVRSVVVVILRFRFYRRVMDVLAAIIVHVYVAVGRLFTFRVTVVVVRRIFSMMSLTRC